jgi:hypothetical protein
MSAFFIVFGGVRYPQLPGNVQEAFLIHFGLDADLALPPEGLLSERFYEMESHNEEFHEVVQRTGGACPFGQRGGG